MEKKFLDILRPDDWHVHLREGEILSSVLPFTYETFRSALIMPNLDTPITNISLAENYYNEICKQIPRGIEFTPNMTLYLTNDLSKNEIEKVSNHEYIKAIKMYPKGATTNSDSGISDFKDFYHLFEVMEESGVILSIHGEVTDEKVDVFERESVFIEKVLTKIIKQFPSLKIVLEHITSADAVKFINEQSMVAATITIHHLMVNRNIMLSKGIRPDFYCAPILKTEYDRRALVQAAISGNRKFFLGTDSAPHLDDDKESACGCAGCFTATNTLEILAHIFEEQKSLNKLELFTSINGANFYGKKVNMGKIKLIKNDTPTLFPKKLATPRGKLTIFKPNFETYWEVKNE